jgi:alkanesulfonate monooxygenase SsuD/methylene tetrahydromethanopterin reductase-like flavin-dependent oxidoreductase (luciferase family)
MAGEVADGVHVHPMHSLSYLDEVARPALVEGATRAGRDPDALTMIVPILPIVGDTDEERATMAKMVRQQLGFYGSTPAYAFQFDRLGFDGLSAKLNALLKQGDIAAQAELLTDEVIDHFVVRATWNELADALVERYRGRADRLVAYHAYAMWRNDHETLDRWGEVARQVAAAA